MHHAGKAALAYALVLETGRGETLESSTLSTRTTFLLHSAADRGTLQGMSFRIKDVRRKCVIMNRGCLDVS